MIAVAGHDGLNWERWCAQSKVFGDPRGLMFFFASTKQVADRKITLGSHIYYQIGDKTGVNRFIIVVDSSNGNTWIHVNYPE